MSIIDQNTCFLLKYEDNYADEFKVEGFTIYDSTYRHIVQAIIANFKDLEGSYEFYFGSNQWIEYKTFKSLFNRFEIIEIPFDEYTYLRKTFGLEYGIIPDLREIYYDYFDTDYDDNE